ncbi:hypothetical protein L3V59_07100 [Burkholderia aenigmatica]|uniref:hypothetical protein n=1 Tax=Burkholderia aenigmatica TaxID=2015348 RepID=UPI001F19C1CA|nr:hypothetical protein [Burkholderia aenigmatica]UKD12815.1 hypothetical protein L3V59_07100 [Burkholderia aenigmatica]
MPTWKLPIRFAEVDLLPSMRLHKQTDQVRQPSGTLEFDDTTVDILLSISGRRLAPSATRAVAPSVWETLTGQLTSTSDEPQDAFTSTYGELFGLMLRIAQLGGRLDIVRIVESNEGPSPDYLLISQAMAHRSYHLLECKGSTVDHFAVKRNNGSSLYVCAGLADQRNAARGQLDSRLAHGRPGASISVSQGGILTLPAHSAAISCVSVPDGRFASAWPLALAPIPDRACQGDSCGPCIVHRNAIPIDPTLPAPAPYMANLIAVMAEKRLIWLEGDPFGTELLHRVTTFSPASSGKSRPLSASTFFNFLDHYRDFERAHWSQCVPAVYVAFWNMHQRVDLHRAFIDENDDESLVWWVSAAKLVRAAARLLAERWGYYVHELHLAYANLGEQVNEIQTTLLVSENHAFASETTLLPWPAVTEHSDLFRQIELGTQPLLEALQLRDLPHDGISFNSRALIGHIQMNADGMRELHAVETGSDSQDLHNGLSGRLTLWLGENVASDTADGIGVSNIRLSFEDVTADAVNVGETFAFEIDGGTMINGWRSIDGRWRATMRDREKMPRA